MLRGLRAVALLAMLGAAAAQEPPVTTKPPTPPPAPSTTRPSPPPPPPPTSTAPTPTSSTPSTTTPTPSTETPEPFVTEDPAASRSVDVISTPAASSKATPEVLTVELNPKCEIGRVNLTETELLVQCKGCVDFVSSELRSALEFVPGPYTENLILGALSNPALQKLKVATSDGIRGILELELLPSSFTALSKLSSLTFARLDFSDKYLTLSTSPTLESLQIEETNAVDVSLSFGGTSQPTLSEVTFTRNRFSQLPMVFYERSYGRVIRVNSAFSFIDAITDLSAEEFANAQVNLGNSLESLLTFVSTCDENDVQSANASHVVCLNAKRSGVRTMSDRRSSSSGVGGSTSGSGSGSSISPPLRNGSSTDTTLTIIVIVIAVIAAILAYFVARRYFCMSSSSTASPRHNDRTVGLISKEESQAAHGKLSFISGDDTLRQIRLEQQDVSVGKSLGTGFLWSGDYQGRKVVIKRVEAESNDSRVTKALINQARSLAPIVHQNLAKLVGVTWIQGTDFGIVAEFMEKGTLKSVLMDLDTELDLQSKLHMCLDIAQALAYLHHADQSMYMKSLSSRKVLVNGAIECKLNLFECHSTTTKVDVPDIFGAGDLAWWAPELVLHKTAQDPRKMNIFSLGVLICEIVTRVSPYQTVVDEKGHTLADIELVQKMRRQERLVPHENRLEFNELPAALREIVERCLSYQPHLRPTAEEVVQCLEAVKDYSERMGSTTSL